VQNPELRLTSGSRQDRRVNQRYALETAKGCENRRRYSPFSRNNIKKRELTSRIFNWKQHNVAITISELDRLKNAGSAKVVDVVKSKMENAK
jgi:hypothetical protein